MIIIAMSDRRPLKINDEAWPVIACVFWYNKQHKCQANTRARIAVREHADGRRIVYGYDTAGPGGQYAGTINPHAGYLVSSRDGRPDDDETIRAIRRVAGVLGRTHLGDECIADLPSEEI